MRQCFLLFCRLCKQNRLQLRVLRDLMVIAGDLVKIVEAGKKELIVIAFVLVTSGIGVSVVCNGALKPGGADRFVFLFIFCLLLVFECGRLQDFLLGGMINCDCWPVRRCFLDFS